MADDLSIKVKEALRKPGCERLLDMYEIGPVQRAAVEQFAIYLLNEDCRECDVSFPCHDGKARCFRV